MPSLAKRPCPVCRYTLTTGGLCANCSRARSELRGSAADRGYDADWRKVRLQKLAESPLCEECLRQGEITLGNEVDHKLPMSEGGERLDKRNLQTLCKPCHSRKTLSEQRLRQPLAPGDKGTPQAG